MFRLVCLILFLNCCAQAGTVKTIEGAKVEKDSVAELRVDFRDGKDHDKETVFAYVTRIDGTRLYDKMLSGTDHTATLPNPAEVIFYESWNDEMTAHRLKKVHIQVREYRITIQCVHRENRMGGSIDFSDPVELVLKPAPRRVYEVSAKWENNKWLTWIQDKKTKQVVSQSNIPEK